MRYKSAQTDVLLLSEICMVTVCVFLNSLVPTVVASIILLCSESFEQLNLNSVLFI